MRSRKANWSPRSETDKAVVEIEAPVSGTLAAIDQPVGAVVPMGGRIGGIKK
ncbi:lipoyl domain-containing protein [Mesorhizobium sp. M0902]|uniref:lipoyl domain-containing protein n=1 Tax=Mesorhizobium sp. M0902 TaxID=2957021 RepID=UPI0033391D37